MCHNKDMKTQTTEAIEALAARLYTTAVQMDERPIVGRDNVELAELLAENSRTDLHLFLTIHADHLDPIDEWAAIREATATAEGWEAYGA